MILKHQVLKKQLHIYKARPTDFFKKLKSKANFSCLGKITVDEN